MKFIFPLGNKIPGGFSIWCKSPQRFDTLLYNDHCPNWGDNCVTTPARVCLRCWERKFAFSANNFATSSWFSKVVVDGARVTEVSSWTAIGVFEIFDGVPSWYLCVVKNV
jgi:hypothetical protein